MSERKIGVVDGFDISAYTVPDEDSSVFDLIDPETADATERRVVAAYRAGDWRYVTTVVVASRHGIRLGTSSLSGMECGTFPHWARGSVELDPLDGEGDKFANGYGPDLIAEAVWEAEQVLRKLCDGQCGDR